MRWLQLLVGGEKFQSKKRLKTNKKETEREKGKKGQKVNGRKEQRGIK